MKKFKSLYAILLTFVLVFSLAGCGNTPATEETSMEVKTEETKTEAPVSESGEYSLEDGINEYFAEMPGHIYKINQKEFVEKVNAEEEMFVLDIRQPDVYAEGHIKGAVNAPWGTAISDNLANIPSDVPVYVYCYTGQTAGQAVMTLNLAGFDARSVNLGYNLGISKVEGFESAITTDVSEFGEAVSEIEPAVQTALDDYYAGLADVKGTKYGNYKVSEDNLKAMLDEMDDSIYVLSIRDSKDFDGGHIATASNIPWGAGMEKSFSTLPKDKTVVVYCYTGQTAGQTVAGLRLLGYDAVSLNGGLGMDINKPHGWLNHGYEVVTSSAVAEGVNEYFAEMPGHIYKINQKEFVEKVNAEEEMFVLDIRQPDVYGEGHIKGAVNAPWGTAISDNLANIPSDVPVYVYCYTGQTAGQAVMTLNLAGFDARSVNLGYNLGISKVEGFESAITTDVSEFGEAVSEIEPAVQTALDDYYAGLADVKGTKYGNYKVSEDNLKAMLDAEDDSIYVLSIRDKKDFDGGHIATASNIPWGAGMEMSFDTLPMDKTVVVYCYTGQTAGQTVAGLKLLGYDAVSLNGGLGMDINKPHGWVNHGYEVVK